jgi:hypothetical protein
LPKDATAVDYRAELPENISAPWSLDLDDFRSKFRQQGSNKGTGDQFPKLKNT